jgi:hypothetical protein
VRQWHGTCHRLPPMRSHCRRHTLQPGQPRQGQRPLAAAPQHAPVRGCMWCLCKRGMQDWRGVAYVAAGEGCYRVLQGVTGQWLLMCLTSVGFFASKEETGACACVCVYENGCRQHAVGATVCSNAAAKNMHVCSLTVWCLTHAPDTLKLRSVRPSAAGTASATTDIWFVVSVPVLSLQMTVVQPNVSTDGSLLHRNARHGVNGECRRHTGQRGR